MKEKQTLIRIIIGAVIFVIGMVLPVIGWVKLIIFLASYLIMGLDVIWRAFRNILHGQVLMKIS